MDLVCFVPEHWDFFRSSLDLPQLATLEAGPWLCLSLTQMELLSALMTMSQPVVRAEDLARGLQLYCRHVFLHIFDD